MNIAICPQTKKSLSTISVEFLCTVWVSICFLLLSFQRFLRKWLGFWDLVIHLLVSPQRIKTRFSKGLSVRLYQRSLVYFEVFGYWNETTLLLKCLASFSWCVPNSSRERIPIWCNFITTTQQHDFPLLPIPHASPPPFQLPHPNPLLPILFRLKENPRETGHNGGRWKSTVFSFYLSFLCLIFRFLVVLISAICNSYI